VRAAEIRHLAALVRTLGSKVVPEAAGVVDVLGSTGPAQTTKGEPELPLRDALRQDDGEVEVGGGMIR
jgi:hypothetical protein